MLNRTEAFEVFISKARLRPAIWRVILGFVIVAACYMGVTLAVITFGAELAQPTDYDVWIDQFILGRTRQDLSLFMLLFLGAILALFFVAPILHKRSLLSLIGPIGTAARHFVMAAGVYAVFFLISLGVWSLFYDAQPNLPLTSVLAFLPVAAVLVFIQTGAEELVFRGYLVQQLAARFQSPWIWLVAPSVFFGLIHYDPTLPVPLLITVLVVITVSGLAWADLVRRTGNIGAAWGWHFANNFMLFNFISYAGELDGWAWQVTPYAMQDTPVALLGMDLLVSLATWATLRRLLAEKSVTVAAQP